MELHHPPLFPLGAGEVRNQLRLELILAARRIVLQGDDLRNLAAANLTLPASWSKYESRPGKISIASGRTW